MSFWRQFFCFYRIERQFVASLYGFWASWYWGAYLAFKRAQRSRDLDTKYASKSWTSK